MSPKNELAPICLFTYTRLEQTKQTIDALKANYLAKDSHLVIYSDGPKNEKSLNAVLEVREYLKEVDGFASVVVHESPINQGLANSIIRGVSDIMTFSGRVIVLEDDILTSPNFLDYMNQGLDFYANNTKILSVCGYSSPIDSTASYDNYFTHRSSSWGWATWEDRWKEVDWNVKDYDQFILNKADRRRFNLMGSDMTKMLRQQMTGNINSWAIRFCYHQFSRSLYSVHPVLSKVQNIGFTGKTASHTQEKYNRFVTPLDETLVRSFNFSPDARLVNSFTRQFVKPYSLLQRVRYKILNKFF